MTPVRVERDGRRIGTRTREDIIEALREYAGRYGQPTTASFNPSTARWRDDELSVERYYAGRLNGSPWPSLNSIKDGFSGSFNEALLAAGLEPNKPGPARRRKAGEHSPNRSVRIERVLVPSGEEERLRRKLEEMEARAVEAEKRARGVGVKVVREPVDTSAYERKIEHLQQRVNTERGIVRELTRQLRNAERRVERSKGRPVKTIEKVVKVPTSAQSGDPELEREVDRLTDRLADAEKRSERLRAQLATKNAQAREAEAQVEVITAETAELRQHITVEAAVNRMVVAANRRADEAEARAEATRKQMAEQSAAVIGELRPLTSAEIGQLRRKGPAGPAILAKALLSLKRAKGKDRLTTALTELATAAINYRDRL